MELHEFTIKKLGQDKVNIILCKHKNHNMECVEKYLI